MSDQGIYITPETLKALAIEVAREMKGEGDQRAILERLDHIAEDVHSTRVSMASMIERMDSADKKLASHSSRLDTLEELVDKAGLEDLAGVRRWIYRLGIVALVVLGGIASVLITLFPGAAKTYLLK